MYIPPRIDDTLDTLGGAQWFSTLDLASSYWLVEGDRADREKTAFANPDRLYQFHVMPFGLCNAQEHFNIWWNVSCKAFTGLHAWFT